MAEGEVESDHYAPSHEEVNVVDDMFNEEQQRLLKDSDIRTPAAKITEELNTKKSNSKHHINVVSVCSTITYILGLAVFALFFYRSIHLFLLYHEQPCEKNLSLWLLVVAVGLFLGAGFSICAHGKVAHAMARLTLAELLGIVHGPDEILELNKLFLFITASRIILLFDFVWILIGSFWVYGIVSEDVCPKPLYDFAYISVTLLWIALAVTVIGLPILSFLIRRENIYAKKKASISQNQSSTFV